MNSFSRQSPAAGNNAKFGGGITPTFEPLEDKDVPPRPGHRVQNQQSLPRRFEQGAYGVSSVIAPFLPSRRPMHEQLRPTFAGFDGVGHD